MNKLVDVQAIISIKCGAIARNDALSFGASMNLSATSCCLSIRVSRLRNFRSSTPWPQKAAITLPSGTIETNALGPILRGLGSYFRKLRQGVCSAGIGDWLGFDGKFRS
jgi:hypothetical protein